MSVVKRNGETEKFNFNKIQVRIKKFCFPGNLKSLKNVDYNLISKNVISGIYPGIKTSELDDIAASVSINFASQHYEYEILATRLFVSNNHKNIEYYILNHLNPGNEVCDTARLLWDNIDENFEHSPLIAPHVFAFIKNYSDVLSTFINKARDYDFNYYGLIFLKNKYSLRCSIKEKGEIKIIDNKIARVAIETPQFLFLRVALGIWCESPVFNCLGFRESHYRRNPNYDSRGFWENQLNFWHEKISSIPETQINRILKNVKKTYNILSSRLATHATPTLFNSGSITPQLSSCFLMSLPEDSLEGIAEYWKSCALISKWAGGVGSHIHNLRNKDAYIRGTGGTGNGIIPFLKVADEISVYIDQGGNRRPGSHVVYLELWHPDIMDFLEMRSNKGNQTQKAKNLFYAVWISDEFMRCLEKEKQLEAQNKHKNLWYLINPNICNLSDYYDSKFRISFLPDSEINARDFEFTARYRQCIREGKFIKKVSAIKIWETICTVTLETGLPYKCFKDACNRKSNQQNLGTIKSSNLCSEIIEYSDAQETAVCNLASICLPEFVESVKPEKADKYPYSDGFRIDKDLKTDSRVWFNFNKLKIVVYQLVKNLNVIIHQNFYPIKSTETSNLKHNPIGIGIQGLADLFSMLWLKFGSKKALELDSIIFEHIYYFAMKKSNKLVSRFKVYSSFKDSPLSRGEFQFDLWQKEHEDSDRNLILPGWNPLKTKLTCNWNKLRKNIQETGVANSLLIACMPTGSTSTIMGNSSCFEPHIAMIYKRKDGQGESVMCNSELMKILVARNLYSPEIIDKILNSRIGGISEIYSIPGSIRDIFKVSNEISCKDVINHSLARAPFICQSQSMSLFAPDPTTSLISMTLMYSWKRGIKTGCYYMRRLPPTSARKINRKPELKVCSLDCTSCGS